MIPRNRRVIDLDILRNNMKQIRDAVPASARIMAVVKADAYGHGAEQASRAALAGGADMLAVASVAEGIRLRKSGIEVPILVLGAVLAADVAEGTEYGLIQTVCSSEMVRMCEAAARLTKRKSEIHLKIDTGMGRIGIRTREEMESVLQEIGQSGNVVLTGAFTHFCDADDGEDGMAYTEKQFQRFLELTENLPAGILRHCANSAAIHRRPDMALDMVRAGISLYGYPPVDNDLALQPCMSWTAKISYIKELPAGEYISYGRTYQTRQPVRVATITCGYADGYHRAAGGKACVLIHGKKVPVIGRICMDQMMADITGMEDIHPEDEVVLMGKSGEETISAEDLARWSGTISYEILLSVGSRVERIFRGEYGVNGERKDSI